MLFLCYPKCTTCQKAQKWLEDQGCELTIRNIKEDHPSKEELKTVVASVVITFETLFSILQGYNTKH